MLFTPVLGLLLVLFQCCPACLNGYLRYDDSCYHLSRQKETWLDAMYTCRLDNGNLAEINSAKENAFLQQMLTGGSTPYAFIGLADLDVEGDFVWWTSKARPSYTNWSPGEPNNQAGEDCVVLLNNAYWNDGHCHDPANYICEMPYENPEVVG